MYSYNDLQKNTRPLLEKLIELGRIGAISKKEFLSIVRAMQSMGQKELKKARDIYVKENSWAFFNKEYLDSLERIFKGRVVLELFAGDGLLAKLMQERGIVWIPTDSRGADWKDYLPHAFADIIPLDYLDALDSFDYNDVFVSWFPYNKPYDARTANYLRTNKRPLYFVGEGPGGCTGSMGLWLRSSSSYGNLEFPDWEIEQVFSEEKDIANWPGYNDQTFIVKGLP